MGNAGEYYSKSTGVDIVQEAANWAALMGKQIHTVPQYTEHIGKLSLAVAIAQQMLNAAQVVYGKNS